MKRKYNRYSIKSKNKDPKIKGCQHDLQFNPANTPLSGERVRCNQLSKLHLDPKKNTSSEEGGGVIQNPLFPQSADPKGVISNNDNTKKGRKSGGVIPNLTEREKEIHELIFIKHKSVKHVADTCKCGKSNIYNIIYSITKKRGEGVISSERGLSDPLGGVRPANIKTSPIIIQQEFENNQERVKKEPQNSNRGDTLWWRYHGIQLHVRFHINDCENGGSKLKRRIGSKDFEHNGVIHTVTARPPDKMGYASMDVYFKGEGIKGTTSKESLNRGQKEIKALCERIGWAYGIHFNHLLEGHIRIVKGEIAEVGNELAVQYVKERRKFKVRGTNGKVWLTIDWSIPGLSPELEIKGDGETLKPDADLVETHFNIIREHPGLMNPLQVHEAISGLTVVVQQVVSVIKEYPKTKNDDKDAMYR